MFATTARDVRVAVVLSLHGIVLLACPACLPCLPALLACPACLPCLPALLACPASWLPGTGTSPGCDRSALAQNPIPNEDRSTFDFTSTRQQESIR